MSADETSPPASQEGPASSKRWGNPIWFASLKPSWAEAFSQESDIIKEARIHFFSNHPHDWVHNGTNDLSNVFKGLVERTTLLGEAIYEIQLSWTLRALRCYAGHTYCPWCRKEGQNEGTMVNHLRTTHYRLSLMCDQCFGCPTVKSDMLCWHGHLNCQRYCIASGSGLSN